MSKATYESALTSAAAEFVNRESNRTSLITVTRVELDDRERGVKIFISVFPDTASKNAVEFLERRAEDFRDFLKKRISVRSIPRPIFLLEPDRDLGDASR